MNEVLKTITEVDLRTSLEAGYKFSFPEMLSDVNPKLAQQKASTNFDYYHKNLPALTNTETKTTYIPLKRVSELTENLEITSDLMDMNGVLRHEIGQQLCKLRGWREQRELFQTFVQERNALVDNAAKLPKNVRHWFSYNKEGTEYAFEQTTTDLYATAHGGLGGKRTFEEYLQTYFPKTQNLLKKNNWYR